MDLWFISCALSAQEINLAGEWEVALDSLDIGVTEKWADRSFPDHIVLPGTLCEGGYGIPCSFKPVMDKGVFAQLKRKYDYVGAAWYRKEVHVPESWKGKQVFLTLERVIWQSRIWVNGKPVNHTGESLSVPHSFDIGGLLLPGKKNTLVLRIDNRPPKEIKATNWSHAYTNQSQTIWNGVVGKIALTVKNRNWIETMELIPDVDNEKVRVRICLGGEDASFSKPDFRFFVEAPAGKRLPVRKSSVVGNEICFDYPIHEMKTWDEFAPNLYEAVAILRVDGKKERRTEQFGMRKLTNEHSLLQINGRRLFLRGTLECCVFPLTGYPPTGEPGWEKVFRTARNYGLNHLRFHSWCPPEAAFRVADRMGFYLQVELPWWDLKIGSDKGIIAFQSREAERIMNTYGNHPSFCFWSLGNELKGDYEVLDDILVYLRENDGKRRLYSATTFSFGDKHGRWPESNDDFWVTQWTKKGWIRGQGIFDTKPICFNEDYSASIEGLTVPVVAHEVGQYGIYPDLKGIGKYTGCLLPLGLEAVAKDLEKKGRLDMADDYLTASGMFAKLLYKEEIERALKTPGFSGFQLLGLRDFPGQSMSLVGVLDAFWDSKGIVSAEEFRRFCAPVVPLARFEKAVYMNNETLDVMFEAANFSSEELKQMCPKWSLKDMAGTSFEEGSLPVRNIPVGNACSLGAVSISLSEIDVAKQLILSLEMGEWKNSWHVWVYPSRLPNAVKDIVYTRDLEEAKDALRLGKKVLLNPTPEAVYGINGKFVPVFWSPLHFPKQVGTMGILCDPTHPSLVHFPTERHSNWQWWDICKHAAVMELDRIDADLRPIICMMDNFFKNRNLALLFEARVGKGRLLVCSVDFMKNSDTRPVSRQLRYSLLKYMDSRSFDPKNELSEEQLQCLFHP